MTEPTEIIDVDTDRVACDGGGGALGHPRIYMTVPEREGHIDCPYCSRRYVLKRDAMAPLGLASGAAGSH